MRLGCEVDDRVGVFCGFGDFFWVLDFVDDQCDVEVFEVLVLVGVGELVEHDNFVVVVARVDTDEVGVDEAGFAVDE